MIKVLSFEYFKKINLQEPGSQIFYMGNEFNQFQYLKSRSNTDSYTLNDPIDLSDPELENNTHHVFSEVYKISANDFWKYQFSSKNNATDGCQRELYYIKIFNQTMLNPEKNIVFVFQNPNLCRLISKQQAFKRLEVNITFKEWMFYSLINIQWLFKYLRELLRFLTQKIILQTYRERSVFTDANKKNVLICTHLSAKSKIGEAYKDPTFHFLENFYEQSGYSVWYFPVIFAEGLNYFRLVKKIARFNTKFYFPLSSLPFFIFFKFLNSVSKRNFKSISVNLGDVNLEKYFKYLIRKSSFNPQDLSTEIIQHALSQKDSIKFDICVYPFENNIIEKNLLQSFRISSPRTFMIGYQHTVWYKQQLSMKLTSFDLESRIPLPDRIITSGKIYNSILKESGFPVSLLFDGPSLRFGYLRQFNQSPEGYSISIILNYNLNQNLNCLSLSLESLSDIEYKGKVLIKSHPSVDASIIKKYLKKYNQLNISFTDKPVLEVASSCRLVIMPLCSVSNLEVLSIGKPLIRTSFKLDFNLDPLWCKTQNGKTCENVADIKKKLSYYFKLNITDMESLRKEGEKILINYFQEISPLAFTSFLPVKE